MNEVFRFQGRFKLALISKGLRLALPLGVCPANLFQACPDFKGIKTFSARSQLGRRRFKLALISKGLRQKGAYVNFIAVSSLP